MSVIVCAGQWNAPSERWLWRMVDGIRDRVGLIAVEEAAASHHYGEIPVLSLHRPLETLPDRLRWLLARKLAGRTSPLRLDRLRRAACGMEAPVFLIHFLPLALRLRPVFADLDAPVFVHVHGADITWDRREHTPPHARAHPAGYEEAARALGSRVRWIANSPPSARRLEAIGIDPGRITVKPLGIPVPSPGRAEPRAPDGLHILYLGRLVDFKGPVATIRAFEIARERGLRARLTVAGDGPLLTACEGRRARSRCRDEIALPGAVSADEGSRLRASADLFTAHSSRGPLTHQEEAFGVAFAEAMAAGLPVATGASGFLPDLIRDGETGLLFPPNDIEAHAEALLRLGQDPELRRRLGENARADVRERFSPEREAGTLRRLLAEAE